MKDLFEFAAGSVRGEQHIDGESQDARHILSSPDLFVAVICDGCGGRPNSIVGAKIGSQLLAHIIAEQVRLPETSPPYPVGELEFWEEVKDKVLAHITVLAKDMGNDFSKVIFNNFLFTVLGVLVTPETTVFFRIGDGVVVINGQVTTHEYPDNTPVYLCYGLDNVLKNPLSPELIQFQIQVFPTHEVNNFLLATDGAKDLMSKATENMPGEQELVGSLSQFWETDLYFKDKSALTSKLVGINGGIFTINVNNNKVNKDCGLLEDDTTIVCGRRVLHKKAEKNQSQKHSVALVPYQEDGIWGEFNKPLATLAKIAESRPKG